MFDLVCFFFIYLPVMNVIRDSKAAALYKLGCAAALLTLMASYLATQITPSRKWLRFKSRSCWKLVLVARATNHNANWAWVEKSVPRSVQKVPSWQKHRSGYHRKILGSQTGIWDSELSVHQICLRLIRPNKVRLGKQAVWNAAAARFIWARPH